MAYHVVLAESAKTNTYAIYDRVATEAPLSAVRGIARSGTASLPSTESALPTTCNLIRLAKCRDKTAFFGRGSESSIVPRTEPRA